MIDPDLTGWTFGIIGSVTSGLLLAGIIGLFKLMHSFMTEQRKANEEQRKANERNKEFEHSMERAEISRIYRNVVERNEPITVEELDHVSKCYKAYHGDGANGSGTVMFNKIIENVELVTSATMERGGDKDGNR